MSQTIEVVLTVTITDGTIPALAGESLFNTACEYANDEEIESVDDWKVITE